MGGLKFLPVASIGILRFSSVFSTTNRNENFNLATRLNTHIQALFQEKLTEFRNQKIILKQVDLLQQNPADNDDDNGETTQRELFPDLHKIDYGCFCRNLTKISSSSNTSILSEENSINLFHQSGHPIDEVDRLCKYLVNGWTCLKSQGVDLSISYSSPGRMANNMYEAANLCEKINFNLAQIKLCQVEEQFANGIISLFFSGYSFNKKEDNPISNEDDRRAICHPTGGIMVDDGVFREHCCSLVDYPRKEVIFGEAEQCLDPEEKISQELINNSVDDDNIITSSDPEIIPFEEDQIDLSFLDSDQQDQLANQVETVLDIEANFDTDDIIIESTDDSTNSTEEDEENFLEEEDDQSIDAYEIYDPSIFYETYEPSSSDDGDDSEIEDQPAAFDPNLFEQLLAEQNDGFGDVYYQTDSDFTVFVNETSYDFLTDNNDDNIEDKDEDSDGDGDGNVDDLVFDEIIPTEEVELSPEYFEAPDFSFEDNNDENAEQDKDKDDEDLSENQTEEQIDFISESALDLENFGNPSQLIENPSGLSKNCVCQNGFELPPKYCKEENANQCLYCDFGYSLTNSRNCVKDRALE